MGVGGGGDGDDGGGGCDRKVPPKNSELYMKENIYKIYMSNIKATTQNFQIRDRFVSVFPGLFSIAYQVEVTKSYCMAINIKQYVVSCKAITSFLKIAPLQFHFDSV